MHFGINQRILMLMLSAVLLIAFVPFAQAQGIPCMAGEGCPEPVNAAPDDDYTVQCTNNGMWVWQASNGALITLIPLYQIDAMNDDEPLATTNDLTVTRNGDLVTLSGASVDPASPISVSWEACLQRNGGLRTLPVDLEPPSAEEQACLDLVDEAEKVACFEALEADAANPCEDGQERIENWDQCAPINCLTAVNAIVNRAECFASASSYEIWNFFREACFGPLSAAGVVVVFRVRRRRK